MCVCVLPVVLSGFQIHVDSSRDRSRESRNYLTGPDVGGGTGIAFITRLLRLLRLTPSPFPRFSRPLSLVAPLLLRVLRDTFARRFHAFSML